ncbi:MAG: sulfite reductase, dissimilatory-type subunit alpha [Chromatiales bacterium]|nr:sulfite reductase, dissimilatory-type subunit alpha [Chromatiales bacterium]
MHYNTDVLRKMCDIWEEHGSGLIAFHGQSRRHHVPGRDDRQGAGRLRRDQRARLRPRRRRPGGAHRRCPASARRAASSRCYDEARGAPHGASTTSSTTSTARRCRTSSSSSSRGCPNDCMNSIQRADMAVIGTWRDNMRTDEALARKWFAKHGMNELVNDVVARCPTKAIQLKEIKDVAQRRPTISSVAVSDTHALEIDNSDCVRCMHCINVMTGALAPRQRHRRDDPGRRQAHAEDRRPDGHRGRAVHEARRPTRTARRWSSWARRSIDFFAENALEHERTGEMIERIGLVNFLEGIGVEIDPNMVATPRTNPYVRTDGWDDEVAKINAKKARGGLTAKPHAPETR